MDSDITQVNTMNGLWHRGELVIMVFFLLQAEKWECSYEKKTAEESIA